MDIKVIFRINMVISITLFVVLICFHFQLIEILANYLDDIHKPIIGFNSGWFDVAIIAFVPIWTFPLYRNKKSIKLPKIVLINVTGLVLLATSCLLAYFALGLFPVLESDFIPSDYQYREIPFARYFTLSMCLGACATYAMFSKFSRGRESDDNQIIPDKIE